MSPRLHNWREISFEALPALSRGRVTPTLTVSNEDGARLRVNLLSVVRVDLAEAALTDREVDVRLCSPAGVERAPLSLPGSSGSVFSGGTEQHHYSAEFGFGADRLEEAWLRLRLGGHEVLAELPYGFTRDPRIPVGAGDPRAGRPGTPPKSVAHAEVGHLIPWRFVEYEIGAFSNDLHTKLRMANPGDAVAELVHRGGAGAPFPLAVQMDLYRPHTSVSVRGADGRLVRATAVGLSLEGEGARRRDLFRFARNPGGEVREWGVAAVDVDGDVRECPIPSSLFKCLHGTSMPFSHAPRTTLA